MTRSAKDVPDLASMAGVPLMHSSVFKKAIRNAWRRFFGVECPLCGVHMMFGKTTKEHHKHYATLDHIVALALGGKDALENIQIICRRCNNGKSIDEHRKIVLAQRK